MGNTTSSANSVQTVIEDFFICPKFLIKMARKLSKNELVVLLKILSGTKVKKSSTITKLQEKGILGENNEVFLVDLKNPTILKSDLEEKLKQELDVLWAQVPRLVSVSAILLYQETYGMSDAPKLSATIEILRKVQVLVEKYGEADVERALSITREKKKYHTYDFLAYVKGILRKTFNNNITNNQMY